MLSLTVKSTLGALWVEGEKFINGEKVEDFYSFGFSILGQDTIPHTRFSLPLLCAEL